MVDLQGNGQCRFCDSALESSSHLMSGCQILLADGFYNVHYNKVCKYLHFRKSEEMQFGRLLNIWKHDPSPITSNGKVMLFYDKGIQAGRYVKDKAIKLDIIKLNKPERTSLIIDVPVQNDFCLLEMNEKR